VSFFAEPKGGAATLIASGDLDAAGDVSIRYAPKKETTFFASWAGDSTYEPAASGEKVVHVRVITTGTLRRFYDTAGRYHLYHANGIVIDEGKVTPNHERDQLCFVLERHASGSWRRTARACFRLDQHSRVTVVVDPASLRVGTPYRIGASFSGDNDHEGSDSPWAYFRVTS
jgi:hypothetical protein